MSGKEGDLCSSCTFSSVSCRGVWDQVCWSHTSLLPSAHTGYQQEGHFGSSGFSSLLPDEKVVWVCRLRQQTPACSTGVTPNWVSRVATLVRGKTFQLETDQTLSSRKHRVWPEADQRLPFSSSSRWILKSCSFNVQVTNLRALWMN